MPDVIEELSRPVSLRVFLDAGGDPLALGIDVWGCFHNALVENCVADPATAALRAETAAWYRRQVVELLRADPDQARHVNAPAGEASAWESLVQHATVISWLADLYEDPDLASRLRARLGPEDDAELARRIDRARRPRPLVVGPVGRSWRCDACGERFDEWVAALTIGGDVGHTDPAREGGPWCLSCVKQAYGGLLAGSRPRRPAVGVQG